MQIEGDKQEEPRRPEAADMHYWQIEEFRWQTEKSDNTQRVYREQFVRSVTWCDKFWLNVTSSEIGKYR